MKYTNRKSLLRTTRGLVLVACIASFGALRGQTFYGSIVGTVTDASGSSVPDASVTLTNTATSQRRSTQSSEDGHYEFVNLIPGHYNLQVEKAGFKRITRSDIEVQVQAAVRVDASMQIGDVGQTIEVTAQTLRPSVTSAELSPKFVPTESRTTISRFSKALPSPNV